MTDGLSEREDVVTTAEALVSVLMAEETVARVRAESEAQKKVSPPSSLPSSAPFSLHHSCDLPPHSCLICFFVAGGQARSRVGSRGSVGSGAYNKCNV